MVTRTKKSKTTKKKATSTKASTRTKKKAAKKRASKAGFGSRARSRGSSLYTKAKKAAKELGSFENPDPGTYFCRLEGTSFGKTQKGDKQGESSLLWMPGDDEDWAL